MLDERDLVDRMRRGDQQAFNDFFDTYAPRLSSFAARRSPLDAVAIEDVVQMTMIKAMRNLGGFRGGAALFTWLCKICRNQLADIKRTTARRPTLQSLDDLAAEHPLATVTELTEYRDPLDECEIDSTRGAVRRVVNSLPPHYAKILELRFGDELSGREIAQTLQLSENAAESLLARARQAFGAAWASHLSVPSAGVAPRSEGAG